MKTPAAGSGEPAEASYVREEADIEGGFAAFSARSGALFPALRDQSPRSRAFAKTTAMESAILRANAQTRL